ncbi:MAG: FAD-dependent oxidoreductase [Salinisphaeraceae bacterium]|nr:FAD-dependent oxidoreductase [Salinisphaeraceae bacterium]
MSEDHQLHRVVIIGGGFGGLFAARELGNSGYDVTLLDKRNFHTFQPLLYQVASGMLTPGDVCVPHRVAMRRYKNVKTVMGAAYDIDPDTRVVTHQYGELPYDTLIVATGVKHDYFGHDDWQDHAPGLKTVEHALRMRRKIFYAFEMAEQESDPVARERWLTFVVVGAGPTGVELAGAIGELANRTMPGDFRRIDPRNARILLVEGADRILPGYPEALSREAEKMLGQLGVTVRTRTLVEDIEDGLVTMKGDQQQQSNVPTETILWAAGVRASAFAETLAKRTRTPREKGGRLRGQPDLSLQGHPEIFVIGDLADITDARGVIVPGLAPAAIQQGEYVAGLLKKRLKARAGKPFVYKDKGSMAVIGRNRAVGDLGWARVAGFWAWLLWIGVHIWSLIGNERRSRVMLQWMWKYFSHRTGDRLITGRPPSTRRLKDQESRKRAA